jgi:tRNA/tmRNA/rRNA uracil-C5-methylase (TrmA/RlmC/RlmD family)
VTTERIAHGGFVVARHEGVVVFVRHALPGERVVVEVTEGQEGDRFLRADAVQVLEASADRVEPPCPFSGPGLCGGCDFQHVAVPAQRLLKAAVVAEQLQRLAGLDVEVLVEEVSPDALDWRTRVQWAVAPDGTPGLRGHR